MIYAVEVAATKDPSRKIKIEYTQEMIDELKIIGIDGHKELMAAAQFEADAEYERELSKE